MAVYRRAWLLLPSVVVWSACARTSMVSVPAPAAAGRPLHTVLVIAHLADPGLSAETERRFVAAGGRGRTRFIASQAVLFPGREDDSADLASIVRRNQVDGILVISSSESGARRDSMATSYTTIGCAVWTAEIGCQDVPVVVPGYQTSTPWAQFTARVYDAATGEPLWSASSTTRGTTYAGAATLVHSMAATTLARLARDGVIRGPIP